LSNIKFFAAGILILFPLLTFSAPVLSAEEDLSIGRMRVMIWPEYDDSGVLVVYDGRFVEGVKFPTKTKFFIPKDVVVNDVCSLSPGGQHFCQLYEIEKGPVQDIVNLSLPYSNFYLSFHTPPLDLKSENRVIDYKLMANHPIRNLEIDIQQPLRSAEFRFSQSGGKTPGVEAPGVEVKEKKGFKHYQYTLKNIAKGEQRVLKIRYVKKDGKPSVDIKFASMSGPRVWGSPYETQRKVKTLIYVLFATGAAAVGGVAWIVIWRRKKKART